MIHMDRYTELYKSKGKKFPTFTFEIFGGIFKEFTVKAPNKTIARIIARGELSPWIGIGKVVKIEGEVLRLPKSEM